MSPSVRYGHFMRYLHERLVMLVTLLFVAVVAAQTGSSAAVAITVAVAAIATIRIATMALTARTLAVGTRAHAHREVLSEMAAPQHPDTAGRPRTRAPSQAAPAF